MQLWYGKEARGAAGGVGSYTIVLSFNICLIGDVVMGTSRMGWNRFFEVERHDENTRECAALAERTLTQAHQVWEESQVWRTAAKWKTELWD